MRALPFVLAWVASLCGSGHASLLFCQEPRPPFCQEMFGPFGSSSDFQLCRIEVERFRQQTRAYVACLADAQEEALRRLDRVIDDFNRRARQ